MKLIKEIIKQQLGVDLPDADALVHANELERQLREEYHAAGAPYGLSENAVLRYIQERVNTELIIITK